MSISSKNSLSARCNALMNRGKNRTFDKSEVCLPKRVIPFEVGTYDMAIVTFYPMKTTNGDKVVIEVEGDIKGGTIREKKFYDGGSKINSQSELGILLNAFGAVDQTNYIDWNRLEKAAVSVTFGKSKSGNIYIKKIIPLMDDEDEAYSEEDEVYEEYDEEDDEDEAE